MGGASLVDAAKVNAIEGELDSFVARRDKARRRDEGERGREELYMESVRRHHARREAELAWAWLRFHARQLKNHETVSRLITAHHEAEIHKYEEMLGLNHKESA